VCACLVVLTAHRESILDTAIHSFRKAKEKEGERENGGEKEREGERVEEKCRGEVDATTRSEDKEAGSESSRVRGDKKETQHTDKVSKDSDRDRDRDRDNDRASVNPR
jgi:hypothetical protein